MRNVLLVVLLVFVLLIVGCVQEPDPTPEVTTTPSVTPDEVANELAQRAAMGIATAVPDAEANCVVNAQSADSITMTCQLFPGRRPTPPAPPATRTPRNTPLPTPVIITSTPPATATLVPTAVPTSLPIPTIPAPGTPGAEIKPYREAPPCDDHNPTVWHPLWNAALGCHGEHEHAASPFEQWVVDTWGDYTQYTAGQQVSYPWQTFSAHGPENEVKHAGYSFDMRDLRPEYPCLPQFENRYGVSAFFVESHNLATAEEYTGRVHSFFGMAVLCDSQNPDYVGFVVAGGHSDFGQLVSPYQGVVVPKPNTPLPAYNSPKPPYFTLDCAGVSPCKQAGGNTTWSSVNQSGGVSGIISNHFQFGFRQEDVYIFLPQAEVTKPNPAFELFCKDAAGNYNPVGCWNNGSTFQVYTAVYTPNPLWDGMDGVDEDGVKDGFINYNGFADLQGNPTSECHEYNESCTPLVLNNVPAQQASVNLFTVDPERFMPFSLPDYDVCFLASGVHVDCSEEDAIPSGWILSEN